MVVITCAGCGSSTHAPPRLHTRTVGLISIFQADAQVYSNPLAAFRLLRSLGVDRVRVFVPWGAAAPRPEIAPDPTSRQPPAGFNASDPNAYTTTGLSLYDSMDRDAAATGVGLYFVLGGPPPLWAAGRGALDHPQWRPNARDFGEFVHMIGARYSGTYTPSGATTPLPRIDFWGIWNEPNYGADLAPQAIDNWRVEVSPAIYRGLLDAAWSALNVTGHGRDTILIGELAPRGVRASDGMPPLRFLRALYCVDSSYRQLRGAAATARGCPANPSSRGFIQANPALFGATGLAIHPYPQGLPPDVLTPGEPDYADLPALPRAEHALDRMQLAYGSSKRLPLYSTEFGYKTNPPFPGGVSPATAADYINWAEYRSWRDPRIRSYDQYLLTDPPCMPDSCFATGLEFINGTPKADLAAYRMPIFMPATKFTPGQSLEVWGDVRPARYARTQTGLVQRVQIQFQRAGQRRFMTIATIALHDPYGYFDVDHVFRVAGSIRLAWRYPHGRRIFSRDVALTAR